MSPTILAGVLAPLPTPFAAHEEVDLDRLRAVLDRLLSSSLTGFVLLGTSGEAALIEDAEADRIVEAARARIPGDRTFIVGAGRESTAGAIRAARRAGDLGADAVLVRTPGFFRAQMTDDVLVAHYQRVADASPVPVVLYNFPAVTGVNLGSAAAVRLSAHGNIIGIKDSSGNVGQVASVAAEASDRFCVVTGSGSTFFPALCAGAAGGVLSLACVFPEPCVAIYRAWQAGDIAQGRTLQQSVSSVARLIGEQGVPGLKAAMAARGLDVGRPRLPLAPVSAEVERRLETAVSRLAATWA
jgi:4-hydroxy-2-oxoglutarate aldolase